MTGFKDLKYPDPVLISFSSPGMKLFGSLLAKHRKRNNYTQNAVAEVCGCSHTLISMIENGKRVPTLALAEQILASIVSKPYYRIGQDSDYFDICVMDPDDQHWRFFKFETVRRRDSKDDYQRKFEDLRSYEKYKVLGYIDALIEARGK